MSVFCSSLIVYNYTSINQYIKHYLNKETIRPDLADSLSLSFRSSIFVQLNYRSQPKFQCRHTNVKGQDRTRLEYRICRPQNFQTFNWTYYLSSWTYHLGLLIIWTFICLDKLLKTPIYLTRAAKLGDSGRLILDISTV